MIVRTIIILLFVQRAVQSAENMGEQGSQYTHARDRTLASSHRPWPWSIASAAGWLAGSQEASPSLSWLPPTLSQLVSVVVMHGFLFGARTRLEKPPVNRTIAHSTKGGR